MSEKTVNIHNEKTQQLSQRIARVERGEQIVIARAGKPVAELRSERKVKKPFNPLDDPLLRVEEYSYDGAIDSTTNEDIDRAAYGI
jgi:antitoxin (DNA-binding transcriptional repressor) of toxin-antitoxin stability system